MTSALLKWTVTKLRLFEFLVASDHKGNSVQEASAKCLAVQILKYEILQITSKIETKNIRLLVFSFSPIDLKPGNHFGDPFCYACT